MKFARIKQRERLEVCAEYDGEWFLCRDLGCVKQSQIAIEQEDAVLQILRNKELVRAIALELPERASLAIQFEQQDVALPCTIKSLRDFMLFEKHVIDATRGYVKRFMPQKYKILRMMERFKSKPPKALLPKPLWYKHPIYYMGNHLNVVGNYATITAPDYCTALDYELELAAILATPLKNASAAEAKQAIGGFVVFNDFSARNVQASEMQSGFGPVKAKNFINAISNIIISADEILPIINSLQARVMINGVVVSHCSSANMHYSIGEAIAYASKGEQLHAGELFATGTFPGGSGMETDNWIKSGDKLELQIDQVGSLISYIK